MLARTPSSFHVDSAGCRLPQAFVNPPGSTQPGFFSCCCSGLAVSRKSSGPMLSRVIML